MIIVEGGLKELDTLSQTWRHEMTKCYIWREGKGNLKTTIPKWSKQKVNKTKKDDTSLSPEKWL